MSSSDLYSAPPDVTQKVIQRHGIDINIERPKGSKRTWTFADGRKPITATYRQDYGSIPGVKDYDGDDLDVYVGPHRDAKKVYIVEKGKGSWTPELRKTFDEHKVFMGFKNLEAAKHHAQYYFNKALMRIYAMPVPEFKTMLDKGGLQKRAGEYQLPGGIPGGKAEAEGKQPSDFDPQEVAAGRKVEHEHTADPAKQTDITIDHLTEIPDYYQRLLKMEREAKEKTSAAADAFIRTKLREGERRQPTHYGQPAPYFADPQVAEIKQAAYHQGVTAALYAVNLVPRS